MLQNKYKREYRRVFNCLRCRAEAELTDETLKFDTEYSVGGVSLADRVDVAIARILLSVLLFSHMMMGSPGLNISKRLNPPD